MRIGPLNKRVTFQAPNEVSNGSGGVTVTWSGDVTVWGGYSPERGRERVAGGRIEAPEGGVLRVRFSSTVRGFGPKDRVLIDGKPYNIRSVSNPDQRNKALEFVVEAGVAI